MTIEELIRQGYERKASDLHLICGLPPQYRILGELQPAEGFPPLTAADCISLAGELAGDRLTLLDSGTELDGSDTIAGV